MDTARALRFLMVIHTPWSKNLGAPRVQMELAEEITRRGHLVEKFSLEDAFPSAGEPRPRGRWGRLREIAGANRSFAARAVAHVRANASRFDILDANQTDLPCPKAKLGFRGLVVARSVGLIPAYDEFERWAERRWPRRTTPRELAHRLLIWPARRRRKRDALRSLRFADLVNVSNRDDLETVNGRLGCAGRAVYFPFGLDEGRRTALARAAATPAQRLAERTVAFIGSWNERKGSRDWPAIASAVRARVADARFLFLGTGFGEAAVRASFEALPAGAIEVVPSYDNEALPRLLARATVGAFPGYLEGFGFSVLEKLAAGLPTVVYDAPGPRDIVGVKRFVTSVAAGDTAAFAARVSELLQAEESVYSAHREDSLEAAARFDWRDITTATLDTYTERLLRLERERRA